MIRRNAFPWGLATLLAGFAAAMAAVTPLDYAWTLVLIDHRWDAAVAFLRRTVFEGSALGASDLPVFGLLALFALYAQVTSRRAIPALLGFRSWLGFILVATLASGLGVVHTLKWIVGRARPYEVLGEGHLPFTPWYVPGPHFVTEGIYRGSFPSGHTAAAFAFIALAYALAGDPLLTRRWRLSGWGVGAGALLFSVAMAIGSAMARSHWLSDAVAVTGLVWILVHVLYFWGLRVPDQRRYWQAHGALPQPPGRWELRLCLLGFPVLLGTIAVGLGLRALALQAVPYLAALVPLGLGLVAGFALRAWALLSVLHGTLRDRMPSACARRNQNR
ncbi:MAG: phosphatase PAP2 family protein [SAR324 cluster bacterium]